MYRHAVWGGLVLAHSEVVDLADAWMASGPDGQDRIIMDIYRRTEVMLTKENVAGLLELYTAVNSVMATDDELQMTLNPLYVMWLRTRKWQSELWPGFWGDVLNGPFAMVKSMALPREAETKVLEVMA